ncbi:MAG: hypothetical protein JWP61_2487 [Friedmanniella sp.]|nr:hypothetical protein [Friedmanniella sp.]
MTLAPPAPNQASIDAILELETHALQRFDRVVRLAQQLFDVPLASVNLLDHDFNFYQAQFGPPSQLPSEAYDFCRRTITEPGPFVVPDASSDLTFGSHPIVVGAPGVRFYAGQPLVSSGGQRVGSLCILDTKPRVITAPELRLLRDLADWVQKEADADRELVRASEVQRQLLPQTSPVLPGWDVAGRCQPAREVGGDFFDWYAVGEQLQFVVSDVMGKGIPAALIAASIRAVLRGTSRYNGLQESMNRTAMVLEHDLAETATFATMFCGRLDPVSGSLSYVDAGHGLTMVVRASGRLRRLLSDGRPLGAGFGESLTAHQTRLEPGDTLVCVSDGFLDFFATTDEALTAAMGAVAVSSSAEEIVNRLCRRDGTATRTDDLTAVVVRRQATR